MKEFTALLKKALSPGGLARSEAREAMGLLVRGVPEAQAAAFLGALSARRPRREELVGFAEALRELSVRVSCRREPLVDNCGTGGDGLDTLNISTAAAFAAAGAGAAVAKHGNRAASSRAGSADVLEALGVPLDLTPELAARAIDEAGFAFLFAPRYHPALAAVAPLRKALGVRTVFNLLGPLLNPAGTRRQVVGIFDEGLMEDYASALLDLGAQSVMVVRAEDGMDELSLCARTVIVRAGKGKPPRREIVSPEDAGLARVEPAALRGGSVEHNARALEETLSGEPGALADAAAFNAGAALVVAGLAKDLRSGAALARESLASGAAGKVLERARAGKKGAKT